MARPLTSLAPPALEEPRRLKTDLRRLAGEDPAGARAEIARRLARHLGERWRPYLSAAGAPPGLVRHQLARLSYETWLWVMGDRGWDQLLDALAGRVARRLPGSGTAGS